jgi:predicted nucleic acid-binding protein
MLSLALAVQIDHAVYDCLYVVLAATRRARLATGDERLRDVAVGLTKERS